MFYKFYFYVSVLEDADIISKNQIYLIKMKEIGCYFNVVEIEIQKTYMKVIL